MEISTGRNFSVLKDRQQVPKDWQSSYARPDPIAHPAPLPTRSRAPPPKSCCWSCDGASSRPATDATRPGTTGAAWTRTATDPRRA